MKPIFTAGKKKAILLDMNDTLIDQTRTFRISFKEALKEFTGRWNKTGAEWSPETILQRYQAEWKKHSGKRTRGASKSRRRQICLKYALSPYPITLSDAGMRSFLRDVLVKRERHAVLFPGVKETLKYLSGHYELAIVSNGDKEQLVGYWSRLGLSSYISKDRLFCSKKMGVAKPNPDMFRQVLKSMGLSPEQAVMAGNSWRNDIQGAVRAGLDAVWLHPSHKNKISQRKVGKRKIVIVRSFGQFKQIFAAN